MLEVGHQVLPHPQTLLERSAEDSYRAARLVQEIEQGRDRGEASLPAAARRPDDLIARRLEITAAQVFERRVVMRAHRLRRHVDAAEVTHPFVQSRRILTRLQEKITLSQKLIRHLAPPWFQRTG